jgi:uncharacterized surface protein with fasciclin (FAS1) repeats
MASPVANRIKKCTLKTYNLGKGERMQKKDNKKAATIIDLVTMDSRFTKFGEAIKAAGLEGTLAGETSVTVFAPTNEAFAKLPKNKAIDLLKPENREQLKKLLLLHIFPGEFLAEDLKRIAAIRTDGGQEIRLTVSQDLKDIQLGNAKVILPKTEAKNGLIYPLDEVLLPMTTAAASA